MPVTRTVPVALVLSSHPLPTAAVTVMAGVLAAAAGNGVGVVALLVAAVLTGQLVIGWSNDLIDADRDREAGRTDKPVASGALPRRVLVVAPVLATVATVVLSLALGWRAGLAQLVVVACGGLYNLGLKASPLSPVPYALAFGALPAVATLARPDPALPPWWVLAAGALLGVGAHFANVLPDIDDDRRAGMRGAPQRIGRRASGAASAAAMILAAALVLACSPWPPSAAATVLAALVLALAAVVVALSLTVRRTRAAFGAAMLAAGLCLAILVLSGGLAASA